MQGALAGGMPSNEGCSETSAIADIEQRLLALAGTAHGIQKILVLDVLSSAITLGKIFVMRFCLWFRTFYSPVAGKAK